jgi:hypothetical protein
VRPVLFVYDGLYGYGKWKERVGVRERREHNGRPSTFRLSLSEMSVPRRVPPDQLRVTSALELHAIPALGAGRSLCTEYKSDHVQMEPSHETTKPPTPFLPNVRVSSSTEKFHVRMVHRLETAPVRSLTKVLGTIPHLQE